MAGKVNGKLTRFGVSVESELVRKFDRLVKLKKYRNRSDAIRDLIREEIVRERWKTNRETSGTITLVYDHHRRELLSKVNHIQHDFGSSIIATQHVHMDHHNCMEVLIVRGKARLLQRLAERLKSVRGVKFSSLSLATRGKEIV